MLKLKLPGRDVDRTIQTNSQQRSPSTNNTKKTPKIWKPILTVNQKKEKLEANNLFKKMGSSEVLTTLQH